jgi:hypothetical protein
MGGGGGGEKHFRVMYSFLLKSSQVRAQEFMGMVLKQRKSPASPCPKKIREYEV